MSVIIPAFNARDTIARAIESALAEPEVAEVIVIDDASHDDTAAVARRSDDGSGRLQVIRFEANRGPSAARNVALERSSAPLVAILDADDFLLPGRFAALIGDGDGAWDLIADNILFLPEAMADALLADPASVSALAPMGPRRRMLTLGEFVERNISRRGRRRGELGFLKPVIRRAMLERLGLRYDEAMRLGEDYILYATALTHGARFAIAERCGYVAIERAGSLSGRHRTADLAALLAASEGVAREPALTPTDRATAERHAASVRAKHAHRAFLDAKAAHGLVAATLPLLARPAQLLGVARDLVRDKLAVRRPPAEPQVRLLFDEADFA